MSGNINIRRDVPDPFYRYKMPRLQSKVEGKGNGIKTVIPNMGDIARALHRPPSYSTKYFGCELGAQVKMDKGRYIVNGSHDAQKLQQLLDGFITRFVLCGDCLNPETDLIITKDGDIKKSCKACGKITSVDMRHKLCAFILKNPPEVSAGARYAKGPAEKRDDKSKSSQESLEQEEEEADSTEAIDAHMAHEAAKLSESSQVESSLNDWSVDTSSKAQAARQKEMNAISDRIAQKMNMADGGGDDEEGGGEGSLEELAQFIEEGETKDSNEILKKIKQLGIREDKAVAVIVQVLFTEAVLKELPKRKQLFLRLVSSEKAQKAFLGGIERLVGIAHTALLPKIALILKAAYDLDILEEEVIINWGKKSSKKYVSKDINKEIRKNATPFIEWLENAEEESDEDEE